MGVRGDLRPLVWRHYGKAYSNWDDIAPYVRSQNDFAWPSKVGLCHLATSDHLLERELEIASDLDGRLHGDHGAWLSFDFVAWVECQMEN
jgi:hypothetical protein